MKILNQLNCGNHFTMYARVLSHFSRVWLFQTHWTAAHQAPLCPWDSPGKNTGVGCRALLQGIFPAQGLDLISYVSCTGKAGSSPLEPHGKPTMHTYTKTLYCTCQLYTSLSKCTSKLGGKYIKKIWWNTKDLCAY